MDKLIDFQKKNDASTFISLPSPCDEEFAKDALIDFVRAISKSTNIEPIQLCGYISGVFLGEKIFGGGGQNGD